MISIFKVFGILIFIALVLAGCQEKKSSNSIEVNNELQIWADTIIYEVLISNPDTLNNWETAKIKGIKQVKLIDDLFEMIYSGKKKAYHYYTHEEMNIEDIRELENNGTFARNKIGKLQFTETWSYDEKSHFFKKQIHSILLAYEIYDDSDNLRGYKAAFYLKDF